ncbi:glycosyltransferase family 87 protein [Arundinibacter roseus]|uniref:DUF2029 domain-containing protein n=1 Tax=Arundinibacter roseus TaxID=2070510 RepID=A0A4R4KJ62_9BACT|nr:glycosyltransferase family 87 protein [Arundinibacter roseus]TDB66856.1 DUF2029 domain-containing protein [Arundinibacter roseus]
MKRINNLLINKKAILILVGLVVVLATLQSYIGSMKTFPGSEILYTSYNNYLIFKQSFFHLIDQKDLYILYPQEQWDLYKYSPAFALLFAPLASIPDLLGLLLWNAMNAFVLFLAVYSLPHFSLRTKGLVLLFVLIELLTSLQNEQSNGLMAGLMILSFGMLERRRYWLASLCLVASIFIKLFGIVGLALYLFYPNKWKLTYTTGSWVLLFASMPLLVVSWDQLLFLYQSWGYLLANDHSISDGLSVIGWLKTWFGFQPDKTIVSLIGVLIFCLPLALLKKYQVYTFRLLMLASVLLWVVIFNHRAESPTFIIAISGVALWYYGQSRSAVNFSLLILALIFTILSPTDIFPGFVRSEWFQPYVVKAVPCILIWIKLTYDLVLGTMAPRVESSETNGSSS